MSMYDRILLLSLVIANVAMCFHIARRLAIKENGRARPSQIDNVSSSMARMASRPFTKKVGRSPKVNDDFAAWKKENELD